MAAHVLEYWIMSIGDCPACRKLMTDATAAITRHLDAVALLTARVGNTESTEIEALELEARSLERENAVARYESHLASHEGEEKVLLRMSA